ncbi:hypothetical protein CTI12_AA162250 [Artemisia annua]|uniref:Uncharacterized protein n=1 Tax=Artemisia annua TaxID=35608 RepID=A0A2U1PEM2_ARTAN|nr:hypothetical protein CTI12_AA162250 [Artemisia annua]
MSSSPKQSDTTSSSSSITKPHEKNEEILLFQGPPNKIAKGNPTPTKHDPEDRYVFWNGIWHKIKKSHVHNADWNNMMDCVKKADEVIQILRAAGKKIGNDYMVDHNVSGEE